MGGEGSNLEGKVVTLREVPAPACFLRVLSRPCGPQSWLHGREEAGLPHTGSGPGHTEDCPRSTAGMHRPGGGGALRRGGRGCWPGRELSEGRVVQEEMGEVGGWQRVQIWVSVGCFGGPERFLFYF